jgi:ATPase subunit of ABC transporter with duplicated ATPase domains
VLEAEDLAVSYPGLDVFEDVTFDAGRGDRVLVMGLNGAGKTSACCGCSPGITEPVIGEFRWGMRRVGRLLRPGARGHPLPAGEPRGAHARGHRRPGRRPPPFAILGMFGLVGDKVFQDASTLSGGEKTKLALAQLVGGKQQRPAPRRAHQQPRPWLAHRRGRRPLRVGAARSSS